MSSPPLPDRGRGDCPAALTVICGPMFAGKTTELQRRVARAVATGLRVLVAKPARDDRYDPNAVVTHAGARIPAQPVARVGEILERLDQLGLALSPHLVAIDEVHFFASEAVAPIEALRLRGVAVVVAGCDLDHFGDLFAPFDALIPRADEIVRLSGACARCGAPSTHSERVVASTERIVVGGAGDFVATCAACFRPSRREFT